MKYVLSSNRDAEMEGLFSSKNSSLLRESNGQDFLQFSLDKFDNELQRSRVALQITYWNIIHFAETKGGTTVAWRKQTSREDFECEAYGRLDDP